MDRNMDRIALRASGSVGINVLCSQSIAAASGLATLAYGARTAAARVGSRSPSAPAQRPYVGRSGGGLNIIGPC